jgi:N-acetylglucosamine-6-phosphate deacetylase
MRLTGGRVFDPIQGFVTRTLCVEGERIAAQAGGDEIPVDGCYVIPGLTDLHFHGCRGADFSDGDPDGLRTMAEYELSRGITQICPAGMTLDVPQLKKICQVAAQHKKRNVPGAELVGINLEGPFLSNAKKGAQNGAWLRDPDPELLLELYKLSDGLVGLVSVAPELPGALEFIGKVKDRVRVSVGHTACDYDQAMAAFQAGAKQVTHLFNTMNGFAHRQPGVVGAAADSDCMVELICDGIHIHPSVVRVVFKLFGADRVILISDSLRAAGMPDGQYTLGGQDVTVCGPRGTLADGTLAGSVTDLMGCVRTAVSFGIPLADAVKAAAWNPARALGIDSWAGSLEPGKAANLVVLEPDLTLRCVLLRGQLAAGNLNP